MIVKFKYRVEPNGEVRFNDILIGHVKHSEIVHNRGDEKILDIKLNDSLLARTLCEVLKENPPAPTQFNIGSLV